MATELALAKPGWAALWLDHARAHKLAAAGLAIALLGVLAFSFTVPFTRVAVADGGLPPLFVGAGRALIAAAGRAFGVKGFHNTTLDDIAQALGVTKPALYRYVKSKHEILFECHRLAVGMAEQALGDANAQAESARKATTGAR